MAKQINRIKIFKVKINNKYKWFGDKDTAVFFAQCLYDDAPIIMNQSPIFGHLVDISPDGLAYFLNKQEKE